MQTWFKVEPSSPFSDVCAKQGTSLELIIPMTSVDHMSDCRIIESLLYLTDFTGDYCIWDGLCLYHTDLNNLH